MGDGEHGGACGPCGAHTDEGVLQDDHADAGHPEFAAGLLVEVGCWFETAIVVCSHDGEGNGVTPASALPATSSRISWVSIWGGASLARAVDRLRWERACDFWQLRWHYEKHDTSAIICSSRPQRCGPGGVAIASRSLRRSPRPERWLPEDLTDPGEAPPATSSPGPPGGALGDAHTP